MWTKNRLVLRVTSCFGGGGGGDNARVVTRLLKRVVNAYYISVN